MAVARLSLGWTFLWAFLDKTFGLGFAAATEDARVNGTATPGRPVASPTNVGTNKDRTVRTRHVNGLREQKSERTACGCADRTLPRRGVTAGRWSRRRSPVLRCIKREEMR